MKYFCQRKIKTLAENYVGISDNIPPHFTHDDVRYEQWDFTYSEGATGYSWIATLEIDADSFNDAFVVFRKKLLDATPKIAVISQCYVEFLHQPLIIQNVDKNYAYFHNIFDSDPVPLHFDDTSYKALEQLSQTTIPEEFYYYWNDAVNTVGSTPKMLLLFSAIEALCKKSNGKIDNAKRLQILGEELDTKFFENGNRGLRHRLVHGEYFQPTDFDQNYIELIHAKIVTYFNGEIFNEELIRTGVVGPQRHFDDNKLGSRNFIAYKSNTRELIGIRDVINDFDTKEHNFIDKFEYVFDKSIADY
ncbi:hypothetical protein KA093_00605 [Candidatus Saccharibacteria bacterium]|nr:hypothetical protein [Candidatus Saccharibacteria bacterium]